jgi:hypothetical protein
MTMKWVEYVPRSLLKICRKCICKFGRKHESHRPLRILNYEWDNIKMDLKKLERSVCTRFSWRSTELCGALPLTSKCERTDCQTDGRVQLKQQHSFPFITSRPTLRLTQFSGDFVPRWKRGRRKIFSAFGVFIKFRFQQLPRQINSDSFRKNSNL